MKPKFDSWDRHFFLIYHATR
ncbi:unnamed protein product [Debaryomyces tyrocola]|nr:unnamed protein product [Debaryomyces tyrocola]